jgi:hypothetical protein
LSSSPSCPTKTYTKITTPPSTTEPNKVRRESMAQCLSIWSEWADVRLPRKQTIECHANRSRLAVDCVYQESKSSLLPHSNVLEI